ncbi:MAG: (Fe-S)-binding protein [Rhodospirillaceae bacterium]|jgi:Fe-S oxidoreductase|nr:(Fe-S)-binding protein [Rhodospirillaceae bacterium]MBT5456017.1 (Fe-S)-binding protein [Rhodospirillaceae bacterium]
MSDFDYGAYFGPILPLADATRSDGDRCWGSGAENNKRAHDYVLYLGCNVLRTVALAETIVAILNELGVDFIPLGGPATCCGIIHHGNGDVAISEKLTRQTLAKFEGYEPKAVLTYCPSCHSHMDDSLATPGLDFDIPYLHVTEFITENLSRLTFKNRVERKVYLHAHSDNEQARLDAKFARAILEAIPGIEVLGEPGGGEWGHDCGGRQIGIIGKDTHDRLTGEMFATARADGADVIAGLYHSCYRQFCGLEREQGMEIVHYTALVAEALGLPAKPEAFKALKLESKPHEAAQRLKGRAAAHGLKESGLRATLDAHFSIQEP